MPSLSATLSSNASEVFRDARIASLSNGLALVAKERETLIGAVTFVTLPITFLSTTFMPPALIPAWVRSLARFNPVKLGRGGGTVGDE
jgi:hypothetical protein